jgi:serine/threonine protein kinase
LADFGSSAAVIDELEFTVRWAAPERVAKEASSTRESDVWSFGCVCYEVNVLCRISSISLNYFGRF